MSEDPWRDALDQAATAKWFAGRRGQPPADTHASGLCPHCDGQPTVQRCRICDTPLCIDCRIDHHHEGYDPDASRR